MRPSDVLSVQSDRGLARRVLGKTRMLQFGVIADDLTGAMDTGLQFAQLGLRTIVYLEPARVDIDAVPVLDTESRDVAFDLAYAKVRDAARRLKGRVVYKKIDSTLRGNIGWEVDAVMDELDLSLALVSPAFPANGRTTRDGYLLVRGVRLRQTDFAEDTLCPPTDHIPSLLQRQSNRSVRHIGVEVVEQGAEALLDDIRQGLKQILVVDAVSNTHLSTIARAIESLGESCLACGSAGLAQALPEAFHLEPTHRPPGAISEMVDLPVLVVAGSLRQATRTQIEKAVSLAGAALIEIDPTDLEAGRQNSGCCPVSGRCDSGCSSSTTSRRVGSHRWIRRFCGLSCVGHLDDRDTRRNSAWHSSREGAWRRVEWNPSGHESRRVWRRESLGAGYRILANGR